MFKLQRIPPKLDLLLQEFQFFFTDSQWMHFRCLILSLLLTPHKATVNGMVKILSFGSHRSKHNKFLHTATKILEKVLQFYAMMILAQLKKVGEPVYVIIDDTSNKKRGKEIEAAFKFLDHTSKQYIWGQQIVCCILRYRDIAIPYAVKVYIPKEQCATLGVPFMKKTTIAEQMLKEFEADGDQEVFVLTDCYYATAPMMQQCRKMYYYFISVLKSNRVFFINGYKTNVSTYSRSLFKRKRQHRTIRLGNAQYKTETRHVELKTGGAVKVVFSKCQSHRTVMAIFTTATALSTQTIMEAYKKRWKIEVFFKMSKQYLGLNAYQMRNVRAITSSLHLSLCAHNLLTHVFINETRAQGYNITAKRIAHFSVQNMRDRVRTIANQDAIKLCIEKAKNNHYKHVMDDLNNLLLAA